MIRRSAFYITTYVVIVKSELGFLGLELGFLGLGRCCWVLLGMIVWVDWLVGPRCPGASPAHFASLVRAPLRFAKGAKPLVVWLAGAVREPPLRVWGDAMVSVLEALVVWLVGRPRGFAPTSEDELVGWMVSLAGGIG